ncbi:uncharacterized protein LOC114877014 [Osmia bicornis bicornis]|uniref:uncharacterized protein LOC114877014 n=1 Tax=Osmia bicornis bicornis TaxID=1437191 RepID=UPI001EAEB512|nr:uncharacterized protein LOC114877014 [Osmia bicornis bicornis]
MASSHFDQSDTSLCERVRGFVTQYSIPLRSFVPLARVCNRVQCAECGGVQQSSRSFVRLARVCNRYRPVAEYTEHCRVLPKCRPVYDGKEGLAIALSSVEVRRRVEVVLQYKQYENIYLISKRRHGIRHH